MFSEKTLSMLAAFAVTAGGLAIAAPAVAKPKLVVVTAPSSDLPTRRVSYRDLNLATASGENILLRRVGFAVSDVCSESDATGSDLFAGMHCRKGAWDGAHPQIARAIDRAREIAQYGSSSIPAVAITLSFPAN